jgi:hypothetical protein
MLLSICELHENTTQEGHTFLIGTDNTTVASVPLKQCDILKVKKYLDQNVYCIMEYTICSLV